MIHEPGAVLPQILARSASGKGIKTIFTTCSLEENSNCFYIHPYTTESNVKSIVPQSLAVFLDLSTSQPSKGIGCLIAANVPSFCDMEYLNRRFSKGWCFASQGQVEETHMRLRNAFEKAVADTAAQDLQPDVTRISIQEVAQTETVQGTMQLLDWTASPVVDVDVQPIDTKSLFSNDKTYWLVGLTGGLGLSLCEWMVQHGARYLVLSSRSPKVDEQWRRSMAARGAVVRVSAK